MKYCVGSSASALSSIAIASSDQKLCVTFDPVGTADGPVIASEPQDEAGLQPSQEGCPEGKEEEEEPRVRCP